MLRPIASNLRTSPYASMIKCSRGSGFPAGPAVVQIAQDNTHTGGFVSPILSPVGPLWRVWYWIVTPPDHRDGTITINGDGTWSATLLSIAYFFYHPTAPISYWQPDDFRLWTRVFGPTSGTSCYYDYNSAAYDEYDEGIGPPFLADVTPNSYNALTIPAGDFFDFTPGAGEMSCFFPGVEPSDFSWYP